MIKNYKTFCNILKTKSVKISDDDGLNYYIALSGVNEYGLIAYSKKGKVLFAKAEDITDYYVVDFFN